MADARRRLNLGLQGGGAHGAFTWGVLDRLLEEDTIEIEGICGTSAGAMNAAVVAHGLAVGGSAGGRAALRAFWQRVSAAAALSPIQPSPLDRWLSPGNMDLSPAWLAFDQLSRTLSPYQFNPMRLNPLRDVLAAVVDFDRLRHSDAVKLFLCATNVTTGKIKVFAGDELSLDAVMASACLPFVFQAVEIDGEHYWDGGYMGNPPLFPLIYHTECRDIVIVQINPINVPDVPVSAQAIFDRINTLSFNSSLMREMRAIAFVTRLIDQGKLSGADYKRLNVHLVSAEDELGRLSVSSKLNADRAFLEWLFALGRTRAGLWLERHGDKIGRESSVDLTETFL